MQKLIIVGCGPKAIAVAAKAHVLKRLGWNTPEVVIIDKHGPAANWDGTNGYTDGKTILGTTPLEDVGFPYSSEIHPAIDTEMLDLSYIAYKIDDGKYAEWVDRGLTAPSHGMLADYLKWVIKRVNATIIIANVATINRDSEQWLLTYERDGETQEIKGDGLVLTGPGNPRKFLRSGRTEDETHIYNGQNVWRNMRQFRDMREAKIAVIGAGETAAGIVSELVRVIDDSSQIEIITRHPILFTRNENWMEVMYFSKVMNWLELSESEKQEVIRHADRGTFSVAAKGLLDSAYNVTVRLGSVEKIEILDNNLTLILAGYEQKQLPSYDYVIEATGFDQFNFFDLFPDKSFLGEIGSISSRIDYDLSLRQSTPKLHLPGLAALAQGPGFPNLSCLGLLSDRILKPYISR